MKFPAAVFSQRGREIAALFRKSRNLLDTRACDLDAILAEAQLEVVDSQIENPGYAAVLVRLVSGGAGIMIASGQSNGRRRFSLAHEIGHFFIPSHAGEGPALRCADFDMRARSSDKSRREWEANDFAAELLMPRRLFAQDARNLEIGFETVARLAGADMYQVSRTAAAWRLVQTTPEPCALVMTAGGTVQWVARSTSFRYQIPERGQAVGKETVAACVARGESTSAIPEPVDPMQWLEGGEFIGVELTESACSIPSQGQVLSLLWARERDFDSAESED